MMIWAESRAADMVARGASIICLLESCYDMMYTLDLSFFFAKNMAAKSITYVQGGSR